VIVLALVRAGIAGVGGLVFGEVDTRVEPDVDLRIVESAGLPQLVIDGAAIFDRDAHFRIGRDDQTNRLLQRQGRCGSCESGDAGQERSTKQQGTTKRLSFQLHGFPPNADLLATRPCGLPNAPRRRAT
jgi:hypothetical protein